MRVLCVCWLVLNAMVIAQAPPPADVLPPAALKVTADSKPSVASNPFAKVEAKQTEVPKDSTATGESDPSGDAMILAKTSRDRIIALEKDLVGSLDRLKQATDKMLPGDASSELESIEAMKSVIRKQRALAKSIADTFEGYEKSAKALGEELKRGPNRFRAASKLYRDWGAAEHYSDLKQDYLALAETWEKVASNWELRSKTIEPEMKQMKEAVHYVKASATFLERLEEHLDLYDGLGSSINRDEFLNRLRVYVKSFEQLRGILRTTLEKMSGSSPSAQVKQKLDTLLASYQPPSVPAPPSGYEPVRASSSTISNGTFVRHASRLSSWRGFSGTYERAERLVVINAGWHHGISDQALVRYRRGELVIGTGAIWSLDAEQSVASISSGRYEPGCTIEVLTDGGAAGPSRSVVASR